MSIYDKQYYDFYKKNHPTSKSMFNKYIVKNVIHYGAPQKGENVLDIGCGWGNISFALWKKGCVVTGIDSSPASIEFCKNAQKELGTSVKFIKMDGLHTTFKEETFDAIYCSDLVEHLNWEDYIYLLKECHRILKKGGELIIATPNPAHYFERIRKHDFILKRDVTHIGYKTMEQLEDSTLQNGFYIARKIKLPSHIPIVNFVEASFNMIKIMQRRFIIVVEKD